MTGSHFPTDWRVGGSNGGYFYPSCPQAVIKVLAGNAHCSWSRSLCPCRWPVLQGVAFSWRYNPPMANAGRAKRLMSRSLAAPTGKQCVRPCYTSPTDTTQPLRGPRLLQAAGNLRICSAVEYQQLPRVSPKREAVTAHMSLGRHTCTHACVEHAADPTHWLAIQHQCTAWGWVGPCRHWGHWEGKGLQVQMGVPGHLQCLAPMPELFWHPGVEDTYCLYTWGTVGWGSAMSPQAPLQLPRILQHLYGPRSPQTPHSSIRYQPASPLTCFLVTTDP